MTGFGQAESSTPTGNYHIEIRGVNNRFLEIQIRMPRTFANLEQRVKKFLTERIARGSISVSIAWNHEESDGRLTWDREAVKNYLAIFNEIKKEYGISEDIQLSHLLTFSDFIKKESLRFDEDVIWSHIKPILESAIESFNQARRKEAAFILTDLRKIVRVMVKALDQIEKRAPARIISYSAELKKKIKALINKDMDSSRFDTEVAIMAEKQDIAEECTRLRAHLEKMEAEFTGDEPAGKRLGFILQEMNREANTIGSKANDIKISHWSIVLKENIEKIREQSLNIE